MLIALAISLAMPQEGQALKIKEGGFCAGLGWIAVDGGAGYSVDQGPDFSVYRYAGKDGREWGVYSGMASQVSGSTGKVLFSRDGVTVRSAMVGGQFRGYLATDGSGGQNHFFGTVFTNTPADKAFFDRVDFGPSGKAKCERYWKS